MSDEESYLEEVSESFISESEKLEESVSSLSPQSQTLYVEEIVPLYHHVMNLTSLILTLKKKIPDDESAKHHRLFEKIKSTEALINDSFNSRLHPQILSQLDSSLQEHMNSLKSGRRKERTKQTIEEEARNYEKLRQAMSTKEFVEQYDRMIKND